jgi:hypothetical protein
VVASLRKVVMKTEILSPNSLIYEQVISRYSMSRSFLQSDNGGHHSQTGGPASIPSGRVLVRVVVLPDF